MIKAIYYLYCRIKPNCVSGELCLWVDLLLSTQHGDSNGLNIWNCVQINFWLCTQHTLKYTHTVGKSRKISQRNEMWPLQWIPLWDWHTCKRNWRNLSKSSYTGQQANRFSYANSLVGHTTMKCYKSWTWCGCFAQIIVWLDHLKLDLCIQNIYQAEGWYFGFWLHDG